jgi:hypothetical protein
MRYLVFFGIGVLPIALFGALTLVVAFGLKWLAPKWSFGSRYSFAFVFVFMGGALCLDVFPMILKWLSISN